MTLRISKLPLLVRCQSQIDAQRSLVERTTQTKPYALVGSCAGRSSNTNWCSAPRSIASNYPFVDSGKYFSRWQAITIKVEDSVLGGAEMTLFGDYSTCLTSIAAGNSDLCSGEVTSPYNLQ